MSVIPWVGARRIAIVPVLDRTVDREQPADWEYQVRSRVFYDPAPSSGIDRSFQHYLQALSYGRAFLEGEVFPRVWSENAEVNIPAMRSLPPGHGYTYLLAVLPHAGSDHRNPRAFGPAAPVNGITAWARVAMLDIPVAPDRQPIGVWGQELFHLLCNLWEHPGLPGYDVMDGDGARQSVHASATTKRLFGWLPSGIVDHPGGVFATTLHAIGQAQPPAPDRATAVRIPSRDAERHFFVEARLRTDLFEMGVRREGVLVYEVKGESTVTLKNQALQAGQTFSLPEEGLQVTADALVAGGFTVSIRARVPPLVDRSAEFGTPAAAGAPTACVIPALGVHDIVYRDTSGRLHELWRDSAGRTGTTNLTGIAAAPAAVGNPYAYVDTSTSSMIVLYRSGSGDVHSLYWSTGPVGHDNLTGSINAPKAVGDATGWFTPAIGVHHVVYRSANGHLHALWWAGAGAAQHSDVTAATGAPAAVGDPAGFVDPVRGDHIVAYRSGDGHIRTIYWAAGPAGHDDLSGVAGTPPAAGDPIAFYTPHDDTHQVIYRGTNGHLYELYWQGTNAVSGWDISAPAGAPAAASDPAAYYSGATNTKRVVYRSSDRRLHEISWRPGGGVPRHADLGVANAEDNPAAFTVETTATQHAVFRGSNGHIYEARR